MRSFSAILENNYNCVRVIVLMLLLNNIVSIKFILKQTKEPKKELAKMKNVVCSTI